MNGVTKDATSNIFAPSSAAEWTSTLAAAGISSGNPTSLWLLQEAAGSFADSIGSNTLTNSSLTYRNAVTGWTRKAVGATDGTAAVASSTAIGNIGSTSHMMLAYAAINATPAAVRDVIGLGGGTSNRCAQVTTGPVYRLKPNNASATATGASNPGTGVRPVILQIDRTAGVARVITNQEVITQSPYGAPPSATALVHIGAAITQTPNFAVLYAACWQGAASEMTSTQIRTLLQTLGFTVAW